MRVARRGIVLPVVLLVLVALELLSALALFDALQEWRVAGLAEDRVLAHAALEEGIDALRAPPDLPDLCLRPPLAAESRSGTASGGGAFRVTWSHLGDGIVHVRVTGSGRQGAEVRAIALVRPDSTERVSGVFACPAATRLEPLGPAWLVADPAG